MTIKLIPAVELIFEEDEQGHQSDTSPYESPIRVSGDVAFYDASSLSMDDWEVLIRRHISDLEINKSCALFGGYILLRDNDALLYPQCCSTLADICSWQRLLKRGNLRLGQAVWIQEGHPSPKITLQDDELVFDCQDDGEPFWPKTAPEFKVNYDELKIAVLKVLDDMNELTLKFDEILAPKFDVKSIRNLIWEES